MGLDLVCATCGKALVSIGYTHFFEFRKAAALVYDYDYEAYLLGRDIVKEPALAMLLSHSDCSGTWSLAECTTLVPLLTTLAQNAAMQTTFPHLLRGTRVPGQALPVITYVASAINCATIAENLVGALKHAVDLQHAGVVFQ